MPFVGSTSSLAHFKINCRSSDAAWHNLCMILVRIFGYPDTLETFRGVTELTIVIQQTDPDAVD